MLPLPFAVCARPCATNAVLCTRDGQRFLPFARARIECSLLHAFLNPTECEIECRNHRPRRLGEFRLMNAGDRRGPLGSHSFILGHTPRLTSVYCALSVGRPRGHSKIGAFSPCHCNRSAQGGGRFNAWRPQRKNRCFFDRQTSGATPGLYVSSACGGDAAVGRGHYSPLGTTPPSLLPPPSRVLILLRYCVRAHGARVAKTPRIRTGFC